ncbi:hypothetical protein U1Q18_001812, partial [Sarracenia purpurea var. burkii]
STGMRYISAIPALPGNADDAWSSYCFVCVADWCGLGISFGRFTTGSQWDCFHFPMLKSAKKQRIFAVLSFSCSFLQWVFVKRRLLKIQVLVPLRLTWFIQEFWCEGSQL